MNVLKRTTATTLWVRVIVIAVVVLGSVGCTQSPSGEPSGAGTGNEVAPLSRASLEAAEAITQCLRDRGFAAEATLGGGIQAGVHIELGGQSHELAFEASDECEAELTEAGILESVAESSSDHALEKLYDDYAAAAVCLGGFGYDVPEAPSLEAFIESKAGAWDPFANVPQTRSDMERAFDECWEY
ncbi:MAG: hypothetical protein ABFR95_04190 [Actinomycetota bacterium]